CLLLSSVSPVFFATMVFLLSVTQRSPRLCVIFVQRHALTACGKTQKYVIPNPVRFLNGVRNLLFPWFSYETADLSPQTRRVRGHKFHFFCRLLRTQCTVFRLS